MNAVPISRHTVLGYTISTVKVDDKYQTCIFGPTNNSQVVAYYPGLKEAIVGHGYYVNLYCLKTNYND